MVSSIITEGITWRN